MRAPAKVENSPKVLTIVAICVFVKSISSKNGKNKLPANASVSLNDKI